MSHDEETRAASPIACVVGAFSADERRRWQELGARWRGTIEEIRELPDGYACRLGPDRETILAAAEWMTLDRRCCPFFEFALAIEREGAGVWLRLTGRPGVKEFLRQALRTSPTPTPSSAPAERAR